jgi:hypothetical protein
LAAVPYVVHAVLRVVLNFFHVPSKAVFALLIAVLRACGSVSFHAAASAWPRVWIAVTTVWSAVLIVVSRAVTAAAIQAGSKVVFGCFITDEDDDVDEADDAAELDVSANAGAATSAPSVRLASNARMARLIQRVRGKKYKTCASIESSH